MNPRALALGTAGAGLLAIAAWLVPVPRLLPRPELPEIEPFTAADRVAVVLPEPASFPPPARLGLVQRAHAAGAEVRVFAAGESPPNFAPTRRYAPAKLPDIPTGYHPDQWPTPPPGDEIVGNEWQMLVLTPEELAINNAAVLQAARAIGASGTDDPPGTREAAMLARARRAEIYRPLPP